MAGLNEEEIKFIEQHLPPPYNNIEKYHEIINQQLIEHKDLCTLIIKEVDKVLKSLEERIPIKRFIFRIDTSNQIKRPERIIQKICKEKIPWEKFAITLKDLARFRVVVNFLGDVDMAVNAIEKCEPIQSLFDIEKKETINDPLKGRLSGERSIKLLLREKEQNIYIEIQIMTMFQEAWDKKDHPLVYEDTRIDEKVLPELKALSLITSELLYTADKYFEDFRKDKEEL
jgi:ppGpp synthetase/RelA/SpoT-type nucleotidyltranferase